MNKPVTLAIMVGLLMGACVLPAIPGPNRGLTPNTTVTLDVVGTGEALLQTAIAQTETAQPTVTPVIAALATDTPLTSAEASQTPVATDTPPATSTLTPNLTTTVDTATLGPAVTLSTATLAAIKPATSIPALTILLYGTLPPGIPSGDIRLINKSKTQAYISLQVTSIDGRYAILEYPVVGTIDIKAPTGFYIYVAWVGGNKMVGEFRLRGNDALSITLYRDKVAIE